MTIRKTSVPPDDHLQEEYEEPMGQKLKLKFKHILLNELKHPIKLKYPKPGSVVLLAIFSQRS